VESHLEKAAARLIDGAGIGREYKVMGTGEMDERHV
jgi:hypothetical protein